MSTKKQKKLIKDIKKTSKQLKEKGLSTRDIIIIIASSIGGLVLLSGLGIGGVHLAEYLKEEEKKAKKEKFRTFLTNLYDDTFTNKWADILWKEWKETGEKSYEKLYDNSYFFFEIWRNQPDNMKDYAKQMDSISWISKEIRKWIEKYVPKEPGIEEID